MRPYTNQYRAVRSDTPPLYYTALIAAVSLSTLVVLTYHNFTTLDMARIAFAAEVNVVRPTPTPVASVPEQIFGIAQERGLTLGETIKLLEIAKCESNFRVDALGVNKGGTSVDRGLFQFNNKFQPQVSLECSGSLQCSTNAAIDIFLKNKSWKPWICGKNL